MLVLFSHGTLDFLLRAHSTLGGWQTDGFNIKNGATKQPKIPKVAEQKKVVWYRQINFNHFWGKEGEDITESRGKKQQKSPASSCQWELVNIFCFSKDRFARRVGRAVLWDVLLGSLR